MATKQAVTKALEIKLAHSPDSDDAFMFYALATRKLATPGLKFTHVLSDIETLNQAAAQEIYDVTALSFAAYAGLRDKYVLLDCGASFGEGYGPIVVASRHIGQDELAGLRIHEGQLLFPQLGLHRVVDLGQWWLEQTGLPLPLGGNAVRRALGPAVARQIASIIRQSVSYALEHREEALNYAMQFARDMEPDLADKFVGMYVNRWTLGYGERGKQAVRELLAKGEKAGLLPKTGKIEFLGEDAV